MHVLAILLRMLLPFEGEAQASARRGPGGLSAELPVGAARRQVWAVVPIGSPPTLWRGPAKTVFEGPSHRAERGAGGAEGQSCPGRSLVLREALRRAESGIDRLCRRAFGLGRSLPSAARIAVS